MDYICKIWRDDTLKKEILFSADNDVIAMQKCSAAIPDGCRATYYEITQEEKQCLMEKEPMVQKEEDQQTKANVNINPEDFFNGA
jgi:hypothetical protein